MLSSGRPFRPHDDSGRNPPGFSEINRDTANMSQSSDSSPKKNYQESKSTSLEGYMHGLSKIKTALNGTTCYFDPKLQTSNDKTVRLVCFSPPKRSVLLTAYEKIPPVKIQANLNPIKRLNSDLEEYTVPKSAKIMPTELKFNFNENFDNHLHAVSQALQANIYTTVDLKVKVIIKEENKNPIVQDTKTRYKCDTLVADETGCAKLVLWVNTINEVARGKSYLFKNVAVPIFDCEKYLNTNEFTTVEEIDDIQNINVDAPEIKSNLPKVKVPTFILFVSFAPFFVISVAALLPPLDLIITDAPDRIMNIATLTPLLAGLVTDHDLLEFDLVARPRRVKKPARYAYKFKSANFEKLKLQIMQSSAISNRVLCDSDVDAYWSIWKSALLDVIDANLPKARVRDLNTPPWIDKEVRHFLERKESARRAAKKHNNAFNLEKFRTLRKVSKAWINRKLKEYLTSLGDNLKANPKRFWSYPRHRTKSNSIPANVTYGGRQIFSGVEMAEAFNKFFYSTFTHAPEVPLDPFTPPDDRLPVFDNLVLCEDEVYKVLSNLTRVSKVLERCILEHFNDFLFPLFDNAQHGFPQGRSIVTQLLTFYHEIGQSLDKGLQSDIVYLDIAQAFDIVSHQGLLLKLSQYGDSGKLLQ
ncbi:hypothetical protein AWC38_SpisGene22959 [Stylophora pistillata]|uniref:Uncharacterized protein n=1 Tax=Stylophora pistillata TaxID=50429 RepID=A0A2B4R9U6_STYPI|nr:hypothetical protein AWC38_SpisGene22959 [Stylophora pistillata]